MTAPSLQQVNLLTSDLARTVEFCRVLGWEVEDPGYGHLELSFDDGGSIEWDEPDAAATWNSGAAPAAGWSVTTLAVGTRDAVDDLWRRATDAGYRSAQRPFDAFWGSRFAVICDPDDNQFGLMSPRSDAHRSEPGPAPA